MAASNPGSIYKSEYLFKIYELLNFSDERSFILFLIVGVFIFFGFKNLFIIWINYKLALFSARIALKVINSQYTKYLNLPFLEFNNWGSAFIINSTVNVPSSYVNGILRPIFAFTAEFTIVIVVLTGIIIFNPALFFILLVVLAPTTFLTYKLLKDKSQEIGNRQNELRPITHRLMTDAFVGFIELKLSDKQDQYKRKLLQAQHDAQALDAKSFLFSQIPLRIIEMVAILGVVTIFLYSFFFSENPAQILTIVGLFAAAAYRLMPSINRMLTSLVTIKQFTFTIEDLERQREFEQLPWAAEVQRSLEFKQYIDFKDISFSFPDAAAPTLKNVNIRINKGEKIGLVGSSGSGKTTLLNILLRFVQQSSGEILVDGVPLTKDNIKSWHKLIGYVKQDTFLMEASIKENIVLGEEEVDQERLDFAIEQASMKEFISSLPDGLDTYIGERGSKLSGGQRQRIGIARALYKRTQILLFDEATSALDNETEREVSESISNLSHTEITIFIIAHRITTLKDCDRIFELKQGEIINEYSYNELIKQVI